MIIKTEEGDGVKHYLDCHQVPILKHMPTVFNKNRSFSLSKYTETVQSFTDYKL